MRLFLFVCLAFLGALSAAAGGSTPIEPSAGDGGEATLHGAPPAEALIITAEHAEREAAFRQFLADLMADEPIVGLAVAVVRGREVRLVETFGRRALGEDAPIDQNTTFRIASLSKGFATSAMVQLVGEGALALDAGAARYAPDLRLKGSGRLAAATLENVASHRLGLPPYAYDNLLEAGVKRGEILRRLGGVDPICGVGRCYAYQNVAFDTIADAVAAADGRGYAKAIEARLFEPLGLEGASFGLGALQADDNWARPHRKRRGQPWRLIEVKEPYYGVPAAGGINANIQDMAAWLIAQLGGAPDVLSTEMLAQLHAPRVATPAEVRRMRVMRPMLEAAHYGLGWRIYTYAGETVISHSGSVDGYSAQIAFIPSRNVGITLLTNSRARPLWTIVPSFLNVELGLPPVTLEKE